MDNPGALYNKMAGLTNGNLLELVDDYMSFEKNLFLADPCMLRTYTKAWLNEMGDASDSKLIIWALTISNMAYRILAERADDAGVYNPTLDFVVG